MDDIDPTGTPSTTLTPQRSRRPWRATLVGAVAGGVLAASVAGPVTWAATRDEEAASASVTTTAQPPTTGSTVPGWRTPYGAPSSGTGTDATTAESRGVVLIDTTLTDGSAAGTGLVLDSSGTVLTNYHVVEGSTSVAVTVATTGQTYEADVVGHDRTADIAVLQLQGASGLATVDLDDDGDPAVADEVTAIGNAEGQGYLSAATGTVVGLHRSITTADEGSVAGERLTGLIETDAAIVGGYSGGALLDAEGEVVGIDTAASSGGAAQSFAIPIDAALTVVREIESGQESATVEVGPSAYLGVGVAETSSGLQVLLVEPGSTAAGAGVEAGGVITSVAGRRTTSLDVLRSALASYEPGDRVALRWTDAAGGVHHALVTLGTSPVN